MFCDAAGVTKAHVFAKSWTTLFDEPNDAREHEVVHRYVDPSTGKQREIKRAKTFAIITHGNVRRPPKVAAMLEQAEEDILAFYAFPTEHWAKLRSTNPTRWSASTARSGGALTSSGSSLMTTA